MATKKKKKKKHNKKNNEKAEWISNMTKELEGLEKGPKQKYTLIYSK